MRTPIKTSGPLRVRAVAGTRVVLMAIDLEESARDGLQGFAIKRGIEGGPADWLKGIKYFKALVPNPQKGSVYSSRQHPFQTFLWSDYVADPGTNYEVTVVALYGDIHSLEEKYSVTFTVTTEKEIDQGHGIWFNRGAIASHALATEFSNKKITPEMFNKVDAQGQIVDPEVRWLSRGLAEACIDFINTTKPGEGLRVCAYEFTYQPVLLALKRALERGVDVQIIYHFTKQDKDPNSKAIKTAGLPQEKGGKQILFPRTRTKIPHNKFIVKLLGGTPKELWTGSTNFTDSGFLGQTNVGHLVIDDGTAKTYRDYWEKLSSDPPHSQAMANAIALTPNPSNMLPKLSITEFFSPRVADNMLDWYAQRIDDADALAAMTIPFNVAPSILNGLGAKLDSMRLVILEDVPSKEVTDAEIRNSGRLVFSNGAILGKDVIKYKTGPGGAKVVPITHSKLEDWFVDEELARPTNNGHVFFVHSKILVIDALSEDPLVCSGSANFSTGSLINNDENMLLIRGDKRVADIYLVEFDRIFRHFYTRDAINQFAHRGNQINPLELDTSSKWVDPNFKTGSFKNNRRLMFFPPSGTSATPWSRKAAGDPNPFRDEDARATAAKKKKNDAAKARRQGGSGGSAPKRLAKKSPVLKVQKKKTVKKAIKKKAGKKKTTKRKTVRKR